jgi:hypothetical protein
MKDEIVFRNTFIGEWLTTKRTKKTIRMPFMATKFDGILKNRGSTTRTTRFCGWNSPKNMRSAEKSKREFMGKREKTFTHEWENVETIKGSQKL